jgi:S-adenosylhomocysteine hydrolase
MKPIKTGTIIKVRTNRGFTIVDIDIKSRRKIKKNGRVKFHYIIDKYKFDDVFNTLVAEKEVNTTLSYFRSIYQNGKVECKISDVNTYLAKYLLDNKYTKI